MNQRSVAILDQILKAHSYISVEEISNIFNISRRTVYNDLDTINDWLNDYYDSGLKQVRGKGFYLETSLKKQILKGTNISNVSYYNFSKEERKAWIYIYLVGQNNNYFLKDFQDLFQVSRSTVINDIKTLKDEINHYDVKLFTDRQKGYRVQGDELVIRKLLTQYLAEITSSEIWFNHLRRLEESSQQSMNRIGPYAILNTKDIYQIKHYLNQYEQQVEIEITDDVRNDLMIWLYFFIQRIDQGNYAVIETAEKEVIRTTEEFIGVKRLCEVLSSYFTIDIPMGEVDYFTRYFLGAKVNYALNLQLENQELQQLTSVVKKMVHDFQKHAAVDFPEQEKMIHNLLLHLKPTYYRKKYGIRIQNVLKNSIKKKYPEIFHLTKTVIHHVEDLLGQEIDEDEVAFIAMHFGGWLRKEGVMLETQRKRMLIICTTGLGTSHFLKSQLEELFSDVDIIGVFSFQEYEDRSELLELADFIISTISLPEKGIPIFVVEPILSNEDKVDLLKEVSSLFESNSSQQIVSVNTIMDIINRYTEVIDEKSLESELKAYFHPSTIISGTGTLGLLDLLPESRIAVKEKVENWEEGIIEASHHLLEHGFITKNYIEEMIRTVNDFGPYIVISDQIALPHANSHEGVNRTGMAMLFLRNKVDLLGKPVCIFIVLATIDNEQHLKALSQLTQLFSNKTTKEKILSSRNKAELVESLKTSIEQ